MKKFILVVIILAIMIMAVVQGMRSFVMQKNRKGDYYYTKITSHSESRTESDYLYCVDGFDKDGKTIELEFYGMDGRPIKKGAYLRVTYGIVSDGSKDVKRWEEVKKSEVPEKALEKIEKMK